MRYFLLLLLITTGVFGAEIKEPDLNVSFTLKKGETASVKKTNLQIKITGCGKETLANNKGEIPYCDAEISEKSVKKTIRLRDKAVLNEYTIVIEKIDLTVNPKAQDPWSENSCTLIVRRKRVITI
jgi:hypothetical protein